MRERPGLDVASAEEASPSPSPPADARPVVHHAPRVAVLAEAATCPWTIARWPAPRKLGVSSGAGQVLLVAEYPELIEEDLRYCVFVERRWMCCSVLQKAVTDGREEEEAA